MDLKTLVENALYFLALINPASKVVLLCSMQPRCSREELWRLSLRSNLVALGILLVLSAAGNLVLEEVFRTRPYAFADARLVPRP